MCIALAVQTFAGIAAPLAPPLASDYIGEKPAAGWFPLVHQNEVADKKTRRRQSNRLAITLSAGQGSLRQGC